MENFKKIIYLSIMLFETLGACSQSRIQELNVTQLNQRVVASFLITAGNSCSGYQILRSIDSLNFSVISEYSGICGENSKAQSVTFSDESPEKNKINYYKILIEPTDFSDIASIFYTDISENGYLILQNPITDKLSILGSINSKTMKIYGKTGTHVCTILPDENGFYQNNISFLDAGIYYFIIESNVSKPLRGKFIKQ
jgi:hypothetical protein